MKRSVCILLSMLILVTALCSCAADPKENYSSIGSDGIDDSKVGQETVYAPVTILRDTALKVEQREFFFDFAQAHRLDFLPELSEDGLPNLSQMKWFAAYVAPDEWISYENSFALTADTVNRITEDYFGVTYDLNDLTYEPIVVDYNGERVLPLEIGSMVSEVFAELITYREEVAEKGLTKVTARFVLYNYDEYSYRVLSKDHPDVYNEIRHRIVNGQEDQQYARRMVEVVYTTRDGLSIEKILSHRSQYRDAEKGFVSY